MSSVGEALATEQDVELLRRGYEIFNSGDFDALEEFISPDVVVERDGGAAPVHGWAAFRQLQEPDAFEWQKVELLAFERHANKILVHMRVHAKGAGSGVELDLPGWQVWTVRDSRGVHMLATFDESRARAHFGS
ncbi:MAG: SnoaL-like domain [Thermoleophilaceae bacterium]|jgi:ketosteroid isomerase-like protein|nr:SnoaL-like domain [Thermoleophilaceae bacterium]